MELTWVLVADTARARLFELAGDAPHMTEVKAWSNPAGRASGRDLQSDRPPRTFDRVGPGRHAVEPHTPAKRKTGLQFAGELSKELERGRVEHQFDHLVLVAPPGFLGRLNEMLGKQVQERVALSIDKDLTVLSAGEICQHLPERLVH